MPTMHRAYETFEHHPMDVVERAVGLYEWQSERSCDTEIAAELLMLANETLWLGHFTIWIDEGLPMFRHALPLRGAKVPTIGQIQDMVETALYECERFYPAFQFVIWGGRSAKEAMAAALLETVGEA